jgi:hypothetical protein
MYRQVRFQQMHSPFSHEEPRKGETRGTFSVYFRITSDFAQLMPTMSKKESIQVSSYSRKLRDNVKSILDNYSEILKASKAGL